MDVRTSAGVYPSRRSLRTGQTGPQAAVPGYVTATQATAGSSGAASPFAAGPGAPVTAAQRPGGLATAPATGPSTGPIRRRDLRAAGRTEIPTPAPASESHPRQSSRHTAPVVPTPVPRRGPRASSLPSQARLSQPLTGLADGPFPVGISDAAVDTQPNEVPDTGGQLDWLAPSGSRPAPGDPSEPRTPKAWAASLRTTVAGVDLRSRATRWLPQAGVVAVMAAATVGNTLAGPFSPSSSTPAASSFAPREQVDVGVDDSGEPAVSDVEAASEVVEGEDGLLRARESAAASRDGARGPLPECDGVPPEHPLPNGRIPDEHLCVLPDGEHYLRADAAVAFALLDQAFTAEFGYPLCVTSGYRTYAEQAALRARKPGLAAVQGQSWHGDGLAVDLCGGVENADKHYWWLRENAPAFCFDNPPWARPGGSKPEPWHWEFCVEPRRAV